MFRQHSVFWSYAHDLCGRRETPTILALHASYVTLLYFSVRYYYGSMVWRLRRDIDGQKVCHRRQHISCVSLFGQCRST